MAELLSFSCSSCGARYALPDGYRDHLEGRAVFCAGCERWWLALPATSGPPVKLVEGRPERAPIDLRPFLKAAAAPQPSAPSAPAAGPSPPSPSPPPKVDVTTRVPMPEVPARPCLRVAVSAFGKNRKGVVDLGAKSFLIGQSGCHLNLPKAAIPPRAIRVRTAANGFSFEGVDGFPIPIGSMSITSGQIEPGGSLRVELPPYLIELDLSTTPGRPIPDLEAAAPQPSAPQPSVPQPSAPQPSAPQPAPSQSAPPQSAPPKPSASQSAWPEPRKESPAPRPAADLRDQLQEIAVDVRRDQPAFGEQQDAMQAALDGDETITDLGASGFQAARFGNPLDKLDVQLVRADGPSKGQSFHVAKSPLVIGRKEGDLIVADRRVSSKHAQLDVAGPRIYTLKDLASTNGTTVNDRPISVGHLQDGDVISFGGVTFEFRAKATT